jgi:hypothetical protein
MSGFWRLLPACLAIAQVGEVVGLSPSTWQSSTAPWGPRASIQTGYGISTAVAIGGRSPTGLMADVWVYGGGRSHIALLPGLDTQRGRAGKWARAAANAPFGSRRGASVVVSDDTVFLLGGVLDTDGRQQFRSDIWRAGLGNSSEWLQVTSGQWPPRTGACGAWFSQTLWLLGGLTPQPSQDVLVSTDSTGLEWAVFPKGRWRARTSAACAVFQGKLFLAGGTDLVDTFRDLWFTQDGKSWTDSTPVNGAWPAAAGGSLAVVNSWMFFLGGTPSGLGVWASPDGASWGFIDSGVPFQSLVNAPVVPTGIQLSLLGGISTGSQVTVASGATTDLSDQITQSTVNLFCEDEDVVCSGHGVCTWSPGKGSSGGEYPPGFECSCDIGYAPPDCSEQVCSNATCIHGKCVPVHTINGVKSICECSSGWSGGMCTVPVCAAGCDPLHGSCLMPFQCTCVLGWRGPLCTLQETPMEALGRWVRDHAASVYSVVTSCALCLAVGIGALTNYWCLRPAVVLHAMHQQTTRTRRKSRAAPASRGYGATSSTDWRRPLSFAEPVPPPASNPIPIPPSLPRKLSAAYDAMGFTPAKSIRRGSGFGVAPSRLSSAQELAEQPVVSDGPSAPAGRGASTSSSDASSGRRLSSVAVPKPRGSAQKARNPFGL